MFYAPMRIGGSGHQSAGSGVRDPQMSDLGAMRSFDDIFEDTAGQRHDWNLHRAVSDGVKRRADTTDPTRLDTSTAATRPDVKDYVDPQTGAFDYSAWKQAVIQAELDAQSSTTSSTRTKNGKTRTVTTTTTDGSSTTTRTKTDANKGTTKTSTTTQSVDG